MNFYCQKWYDPICARFEDPPDDSMPERYRDLVCPDFCPSCLREQDEVLYRATNTHVQGVCMYIHPHTLSMYVHPHVCTYTYILCIVHTHTCMYIHPHTLSMYIHTHIMYVCTYTHILYVRMYINVYWHYRKVCFTALESVFCREVFSTKSLIWSDLQ